MAESPFTFAIAASSLSTLCITWLNAVNKHVPYPYMDEHFHVPQAQKYCAFDFHSWDPKLTTPPGLYAYSLLWTFGRCDVSDLRFIGLTILAALFVVCFSVRVSLYSGKAQAGERDTIRRGSGNAAHAAFNICLFPPLFFFSGLYYTDVLSTLVVILAYYVFLRRGPNSSSILSGVATFFLGIVGLFMRQTNIFWVGIFLAALEWVRTCKEISASKEANKLNDRPGSWLEKTILPYTSGQLHDPALGQAGPFDFFWCLVSIGVSAASHPLLLICRLWPYIALLLSFGGFVVWNGGVVLGDKSNHVATIHLPQMLYFWAFTSFFSFPLFLPIILRLWSTILSIRPQTSGVARRSSRLPALSTVIWSTIACALGLAIVHYNTLIHPFTLADNRHYMFYVFRYTILRHPLIKYALVPVYVLCIWLVFGALGSLPTATTTTATTSPSKLRSVDNKSEMAMRNPAKAEWTLGIAKSSTSTSFTLIWLLATTLSLITAPLVEPRYFIIPWVFWRLHVPASNHVLAIPGIGQASAETIRLWGETVWFLGVNLVTCMIFLHRGFEWASEPGVLQRFMW